MMGTRRRPELLCPAGSPDAARAAVESGADALYLGMKKFNARAYAGNFSDEELAECIKYAHTKNVKVYITSNTLLRPDEIPEALEQLALAQKLGADAVITQDLGLAAALRRTLPDMPLHASTQMCIYNREGAEALRQMGFSRVILARECGIADIRDICRACGDDMEVEVFVHGAVCVSYSGQCLMSALAADRSGNRGQCAQLCRMDYTMNGAPDAPHFLLSPRDLSLLDRLDELADAGVSCFKIEGRMKTPAYVAAVTSVYRRKIDGLSRPDDKNALLQAFNRNGFTELYFGSQSGIEKPGRAMSSAEKPKNWGTRCGRIISVRTDNDRKANMKFQMVQVRTECRLSIGDGVEVMTGGVSDDPGTVVTELIAGGTRVRLAEAGTAVWIGRLPQDRRIAPGQELRKTSDSAQKEETDRLIATLPRRRAIDMKMTVAVDGNAELTAVCGEKSVTLSGPILTDGTGSTDIGRLREQLAKTGGTPFEAKNIEIESLGACGPLKISAVNALRRDVLAAMEQLLAEVPERRVLPYEEASPERAGATDVKCIKAISAPTAEKALELIKAERADQAVIPISELWNGEYRRLAEAGIPFRFRIPAISKGYTDTMLRRGENDLREAFAEDACLGIICGNPGHLPYAKLARECGRTAAADHTFNIWNFEAAEACFRMGFDTVYPSVEAERDTRFVRELCARYPGRVELRAGGYVPLMTSDFCPVGAFAGGKTGPGVRCSAPCAKCDHSLRDSRGRAYRLVCDRADCRVQIMSPEEVENPAIKDGVPVGAACVRRDWV